MTLNKSRIMGKANKTMETGLAVTNFIETYAQDPQKNADSLQLVSLMREWSGYEPKMWGPTIIGFGRYDYRYESGHSGTAPLIGFSPRKAEFSLYVYADTEVSKELLKGLGKFKMGKACIYIKKLDDINLAVLKAICEDTIKFLIERYPPASTAV